MERRQAWIALLLLVPIPSLGTLAGMVWLADDQCLHLNLNPYDVAWLEPFRERETASE